MIVNGAKVKSEIGYASDTKANKLRRKRTKSNYLARSLIRNNKAKDCLESGSRFINSNGGEKLQYTL